MKHRQSGSRFVVIPGFLFVAFVVGGCGPRHDEANRRPVAPAPPAPDLDAPALAATAPPTDDDWSGQLLVVDTDAPQTVNGPFLGQVFRVDPKGGGAYPFASDPRFQDPQRIARLADGTFLLIDHEADPIGRGTQTGALFALSRDGRVTAVYSPPAWVAPTSLCVIGPREVLVTDRRARPTAGRVDQGQGVIFRLDLDRGENRVFATDPRFRAPADLLIDADDHVVMLDADARLPSHAPGEEGVLFQIDRESGQVLDAWVLHQAISPLGLLEEPNGDLLIFDVNADPLRIGGPLGAVLRVAKRDRSTTLVASVIAFRDPVHACFDGDRVLLIDANADPMKRGPDAVGRGQNLTGGGALFALDRASGEVSIIAAPKEFVNPVDVLRLP